MESLNGRIVDMCNMAGNCRLIKHTVKGYQEARDDLRAAFEELDGLLVRKQKEIRRERRANARAN